MEAIYIDDVLTIWPYSKKNFLEFFRNLNLVHPNLRFTMEIHVSYVSCIFIQFLDLTISIRGLVSCGQVCYSRHVLKGIAVGEMIRTRPSAIHPVRVTLEWSRVLIKKFHQRSFPKTAIQAAKKIRFGMREYYLVPSDHKFVLRPIPVCTIYCNYVPSVGIIFSCGMDESIWRYISYISYTVVLLP